MDSKCLLKFIIGVVYLATVTSQQDMPYDDGLGSTMFRHHNHHHHSTSTTSMDTPSTTQDSYRPDADYYESNVNDPPLPPPPPPPDGLRDDGDFNRSPPSYRDDIPPKPKYQDPSPQDTHYDELGSSAPLKHHDHPHHFSGSSSDGSAMNAGNPSLSRDSFKPDAASRYDDSLNAMPPISKHHVHDAGRKTHKMDQTVEKLLRSAQLELKNEMRNMNLRIEIVNKNVKKILKHLLGIEVVGSILCAAQILIPIVRGFFGALPFL